MILCPEVMWDIIAELEKKGKISIPIILSTDSGIDIKNLSEILFLVKLNSRLE